MGNMINFDHTLFIQLANFIITIVVLNFLLIKPVRGQISARSSLTAAYAADIETFAAEAAGKLSSYESSLAESRARAALARDAIKTEGARIQQEMILKANADAQAFLQSSREKTSEEAKKAKDVLLSQVNGFAAKAMSKILG